MRDTFLALGFLTMDGDDAFYYLHQYGELQGVILTHMDDFLLAGTGAFIQIILNRILRDECVQGGKE